MNIIIEKLENIVKDTFDVKHAIVKKQKDRSFGDLSVILFPVSKQLGKNVKELSDTLIPIVEKIEGVDKAQFVKGYVNVFIKDDYLLSSLWNTCQDQTCEKQSKDKRIVIDYSSPNIAKPFSIGHLRSTIIGNIIANIHDFLGYDVVRVNHLGDWGTQFGKVLVAIEKWGDWKVIEQQPVRRLLDLYVKFHDEAEKDPSLEDKAREKFARLEEGDSELIEIWKKLVDISVENIKRVYERLNVHFDKYLGESFYEPMMENAMKRLEKKGLVVESQGAQVVDLGEKIPPCILKKQDGSSLYALRDIAALLYRIEEMKADSIFYVVGSEQSLHFKQLFQVIEKLEKKYKEVPEHLGFGLYRFKDIKMSTRKGHVIFLEDVLNDSVDKAKEIMKDRDMGDNIDDIAEMIGIGAVIFNDISSDRIKDVDFDWERILDFNGETSPYIQYTAVRIKSAIRKANIDISKIDSIPFIKEEYLEALKVCEKFTASLERAAEKRQPYILANYLIEICGAFNNFYNKHKIIQDDEKNTVSNLMFIKLILDIIEKGMSILGIRIPEKM